MRMIYKVSAIYLLLSACATPAETATETTVTSLLSDMRAACGGDAWDDVEGWSEAGQVDLPGGMTAQYESWSQMHHLQTASRAFAGKRQLRHVGFDGSSFWSVGTNGETKLSQDNELMRKQRRDAYISSHAYFLPDRFPADFQFLDTRERSGENFYILRITPENADSVELWIDQEDYMVRRMEAGEEYVDLSDYRTFSGVCTATTGRQGSDDPAGELTLHIKTVDITRVPDDIFSPPSE